MSLLSQAQALARQGAAMRAELWPVTVTLSTDTASPKVQVNGAGSPPKRTRMPHEMRAGFVERTIRVIAILRERVPATATITAASISGLGTQFTIVADSVNPANVGTVWRTFEIDDSSSGSEIRCVCFRLDS